MAADPYRTLGVDPGAGDADVRAAYRRLVLRHHPDHNGGSVESARRFEEVQEAYAQIRKLRTAGMAPGTAGETRPSGAAGGTRPPRPASSPSPPDPGVEDRLAELERELQDARRARRQAEQERERARQAARAAAAAGGETTGRSSEEELGYVRTEDSFSKILADAADELAGRLSEARRHPAARRIEDMIDDFLKRAG